MINPFQSGEVIASTKKQTWRCSRRVGLLATASLIVVPAFAFSALVRIAPERKPQFFAETVAGPYAGLFIPTRFGVDPLAAIWITLLTFTFAVWPRWWTLVFTLVGAVCWCGCGVVAATGGV